MVRKDAEGKSPVRMDPTDHWNPQRANPVPNKEENELNYQIK